MNFAQVYMFETLGLTSRRQDKLSNMIFQTFYKEEQDAIERLTNRGCRHVGVRIRLLW